MCHDFFKDSGPTQVKDLHGSESLVDLNELQHFDGCKDPGFNFSKSQTEQHLEGN